MTTSKYLPTEMSDIVLEREIRGLAGDLNMTRMAVSSVQSEMLEQLSGEMGEDMKAVLNGERTVEVSKSEKKKHKVKSWFKRIFRTF